MSIKPTFQGEVQLAGWSESHNGGCKVTFWLADSADLDAFRALTVRKGNTAGQRLACVLVEIGDDEQPVPQPEPAMPAAPKGGALARLAGQWCNDAGFVDWLRCTYSASWDMARELRPDESPDEWAAWIVRDLCGIASRAQLDTDADAAERFQSRFRRPYMKHIGAAA